MTPDKHDFRSEPADELTVFEQSLGPACDICQGSCTYVGYQDIYWCRSCGGSGLQSTWRGGAAYHLILVTNVQGRGSERPYRIYYPALYRYLEKQNGIPQTNYNKGCSR